MVRKMQSINLILLIVALILQVQSTDSLSGVTNIPADIRYYMVFACIGLLIYVFISTLIIEFKFKNKKS